VGDEVLQPAPQVFDGVEGSVSVRAEPADVR
jgi:hypothetical protein